MVDLYFYRDPQEEENKEAGADESKVPGADEVGPAAIEQGFPGTDQWEVPGGSAAGAFGASKGASTSWEAGGEDWANSGSAPAADTATVEW